MFEYSFVNQTERYENRVKPFFHPLEKCYVKFANSIKLSSEVEIEVLTPLQVKEKFGFELLCDDLKKAADENYGCLKGDAEPLFSESAESVRPHSVNPNTLESFILHPTSAKSGYGVSAALGIKNGTIVAEYVGKRGEISDDYLYSFALEDDSEINAREYGNVARFFNHCPDSHPNKNVLTANVQAHDRTTENVSKIFLLAVRDIKQFEPICYDYGEDYSFGSGVELLDANTYLPLGDSEQFSGEL